MKIKQIFEIKFKKALTNRTPSDRIKTTKRNTKPETITSSRVSKNWQILKKEVRTTKDLRFVSSIR